MKALDILENAMNAVNTAVEAIDQYARQIGVKGKQVTIEDLALMAASKAGMDLMCVTRALDAAFSLIRDLELIVVAEDDDDE